jgi:hypothetical protein
MYRPVSILIAIVALLASSLPAAEPPVDFNRDIRPLLSNKCFRCHGPDAKQRKADLRLDQREVAIDDLGVIAPGDPDGSELLSRLAAGPDERMPPPDSGLTLTEGEIELLRQWIKEGAVYAGHWAYLAPVRPELPEVSNPSWIRSSLDHFVLARLDREKLAPTDEADRYTLARRLALDLTGLPLPIDQVDQFVNDKSPDAYEKLVDQLLDSDRYGERWTAMWLDLARYADSAGYADDPPRTIWLYRDWVIGAFNDNLPFDQFTVEQIAGDLIPESTDWQRVATAFHRNTLTNSEGGTNDEEFRNVAIVDRVNTTMQVWMGTTIRCAQCHDHKYDPVSQEEFFRFFAFFNQSEDADRRDESPLLTVMTESQKQEKSELEDQVAELTKRLSPSEEDLAARLKEWSELASRDFSWQTLVPRQAESSGGTTLMVNDDGSIVASGDRPETETYVLDVEVPLSGITGLRLEALPDESLPAKGPGRSDGGNFVLSELRLVDHSDARPRRMGQFVRLDLAGEGKMIHVAEIEVLQDGTNIARDGKATQSSTGFGGPPERAIDGNTDGNYAANSVTHTNIEKDPWIEVDLGGSFPIDQLRIWNRTDSKLQSRLDGFVLSILNENRELVWKETYAKAPERELEADLTGAVTLLFADASADAEQAGDGKTEPVEGWVARAAIDGDEKTKQAGWAVGGFIGSASQAFFQLKDPVGVEGAVTKLKITLVQNYGEKHSLGRFRISATTAEGAVKLVPGTISGLLDRSLDELDADSRQLLVDYYNEVVPPPKEVVDKIAALKKQVAGMKGATVPVMKELPVDKQRTTNIQIRGNFLAKEKEVSQGVPDVFHGFPEGAPLNRLGVAQWLVSRDNPLTARVVVNRYWEQLFGIGLVATSEEFGTQGSLPSHPQLLDFLAVELMENQWNVKGLLKTIVMSATYRQSSRVKRDLVERDPDNRLLARGPRFRLSAEMIRDQALAVSGLLSDKMYGPSVQPPRPNLGLKAAFGGSTDWQTSPGEDRYRRGLYTSWRRSIPYPSMAAFDAPSRNVCTIRRGRTNTPLQALVTLNDPVYVEAAQELARQVIAHSAGDLADQVEFGFRRSVGRPPTKKEKQRLAELYAQLHTRYAADKELAMQMATSFAGPAPEGSDLVALASWTVISNVLLNLDETLSKR